MTDFDKVEKWRKWGKGEPLDGEPLPCPVCGRVPPVVEAGPMIYIIGCGGEGCDHHLWLGSASRDEAVRLWNRMVARKSRKGDACR